MWWDCQTTSSHWIYAAGAVQEKTHFIHGTGVDEHLGLSRDGLSYFYLVDGLGSVAKIVDAAKTVVQSYSYDSYGLPQATTGFRNAFTFTGREWDSDLGLLYLRARYYDPVEGVFISRDPLGWTADVNVYRYVGGNPGNSRDPSGLTNSNMITEGLRDITGGIVLIAGGVGITSYTGGTGTLVGVPMVGTGTGMAARGVVRGITGIIQSSNIEVPNPSIIYNSVYLFSKNTDSADFAFNSYNLVLGAVGAGIVPNVTSAELVYNTLDMGSSLKSMFDTSQKNSKCKNK